MVTLQIADHKHTLHQALHVLFACSTAISGFLNFLFKVLFIVPLRYLFTIRFKHLYFA